MIGLILSTVHLAMTFGLVGLLLREQRARHRAEDKLSEFVGWARATIEIPWGCIRHHGHDVEPCAPACWLAQEDTGDPTVVSMFAGGGPDTLTFIRRPS